MSSSQEIEEIKSRISVDELLKDYLKLQSAGSGSYKAICPFHSDKNPSLMISPQRGFWHCFGCGVGGDIFDFLMKIENISFAEALKILADRAGVILKNTKSQQLISQEYKNRLYDLCSLAARYWHKVLLESPKAEVARNYLIKRNVSEEMIEDFKIGYAINDWSNLFDFLTKKGFKAEEILEAGLIIKKDYHNYYDRFRHRIIFPIIDQVGRVCGFTGRTLDSNEPSKYVNTPQTTIYRKGEIVFGLYQAKDAIRQQNAVIVVEGQMDVISCHQFGFKNTVASSGTALTKEQIQLLKRFTNNFYFALDADNAGKTASNRASEIIKLVEKESRKIQAVDRFGRSSQFIDPALSLSLNLKIISIPNGKDPDECLKNNPQDWHQAINKALPVIEYFWQMFSDGKNLDDPLVKKELVKLLSEKIAQFNEPIEQDYWIKEIANRLLVDEKVFRELVSAITKRSNKTLTINKTINQFPTIVEDNYNLLKFRTILAIIWKYPNLLNKLSQDLSPDFLTEKLSQELYKKLILFYTTHNELFNLSSTNEELDVFSIFIDWLKNQDCLDKFIEFLNQSYLLMQKDFILLELREAKNEIEKIIKLLKSNYLNLNIARLNNELKQAEKVGDKEALEKLSFSLKELIKQKLEL